MLALKILAWLAIAPIAVFLTVALVLCIVTYAGDWWNRMRGK